MSQASGRRGYPNGGIAPFRVTDQGGAKRRAVTAHGFGF